MRKIHLPDTWIWAKLGDVTDIVGGGTPNRDNPAYFQGDISWATPTDITKLNTLWIDKTIAAQRLLRRQFQIKGLPRL